MGCHSVRERAAQSSAECSDLCRQAIVAHENGEKQAAERLVEQALQQRPEETEARAKLAETLWQVGRQDESLRELGQLARESRTDVKLLARYAKALCETRQFAEADLWAQSALSVDPVNLDALLVRARCAQAREDYPAAIAAYLELLQVAPEHSEALLGMAQVQIARGQPELAAPVLRSLLQHPFAPTALRLEAEWSLGEAYLASGRWEDAARSLEASIARRPSTAEDWCQLANAQVQSGQSAAATVSLQRAFQLDGRNLRARQLADELAQRAEPADIQPAQFSKPTATASEPPAELR